jgi:hypothetical protein
MSLFKRLEGVFFSPRATFEGLAARPVWVDALVIVLVALVIFNFVIHPIMQRDQVGMMKDHAASLKERYGEDQYARMLNGVENPSSAVFIVQTLVTPALFFLGAILLQSLLLLVVGRFLSTQGTYVQVLAALVHASLIDKLLGNAIRLGLAFLRQSTLQTSTGLALLFPKMEITSTPYILLAQIDFFQLWMFGVLALGLAAIFKIPTKKALVMSYALWLLKALANFAIGMLFLSPLR